MEKYGPTGRPVGLLTLRGATASPVLMVTFSASGSCGYPPSLGWTDPNALVLSDIIPDSGRYVALLAAADFAKLVPGSDQIDIMAQVPDQSRNDVRSGRELLALNLSDAGAASIRRYSTAFIA